MSVEQGAGGRTPELAVILTTVETDAEARTLAARLLEERLAACVQLSRIDSLYLWENAVAEEAEIRMMIKTPAERLAAATAAIAAAHPYEVPQILVLEAASGHAPYLAWARAVTG